MEADTAENALSQIEKGGCTVLEGFLFVLQIEVFRQETGMC